MASTQCSECDEEIEVAGRVKLGQKLICNHCGAQLEVVATEPLEVEIASEDDDPWDDEEDDLEAEDLEDELDEEESSDDLEDELDIETEFDDDDFEDDDLDDFEDDDDDPFDDDERWS